MNDTIFYDYKYLMLLSGELQGFKQVSSNEWNCKCPLCGDSKKKKTKQRAYIGAKNSALFFTCFNCGRSMSFKNLLYHCNTDLFTQYRKEVAFDKFNESQQKKDTEINWSQSRKIQTRIKPDIQYISHLPKNHPGYKYLISREVPISSFDRVGWTDNFKNLVDKTFPDIYNTETFPAEGIVFPLYDTDNNLVGLQYRTINPRVSKYNRFVTCVQSETQFRFGFSFIDKTKQIFVCEGPIDSLFLENGVAILTSALWKYCNPEAIYFNDQEPRNHEVCKQILKCLDMGLRVVLLPSQYETMDINDIVQTYKYNQSDLSDLFVKNSYSGLTGRIKFSQWRKDV